MIRILKFGAEWCGPCHALNKQLVKCESDFELVHVDINVDTGATQLHRVRSVPTLIFLKDDLEVGRLAGRQSAAKIDRLIDKINL